jgi:pyruvate/2-oxoglutarate/acetoin dehydrogenase E1 component
VGDVTPYFQALVDAMSLCAANPRAIFLGQSVTAGGTAMARTLEHLPETQRLELPVFEDVQLGMSTGIALAGGLPISCYPRINFLLLAVNQLVLHLDRLPLYSPWRPKVLIRTAVAHDSPMDPGPQHLGEFEHLDGLLETVTVHRLWRAEDILPAYQRALEPDSGSHLLIEYLERY